ncbi:acetyl-CoA C-acetyltransferase [Pseudooceanicola aestuarii]|uniref:acetyl-CoA C-acetyltransferase n=1 Tax=Pseudooceanicola aestuarii TaxID=2697319 RepID=UPI0013D25EB0|nr:acetyl-CoA C-acetyltransferase [Pseudooceanicola aestuarii]
MPDAYICEALRTPRGKGRAGGGLASVKPVQIVADLLSELQRRTGFAPRDIDDIVLGCVSPVGEQGGPMGRTAALMNGWDMDAPGMQVNRFCASGLEAINLAAQKIRSGWENMVIAGGIESMSRVPMFSDGGAWQFDPEISTATDYVPQGISADLIATLGGLSRTALDAFSARSHQNAARAWAEGAFDRSVVPVRDDLGQPLLTRDEAIRGGSTVETLATLPCVFDGIGRGGYDQIALTRYPDLMAIRHDHTAGNSSAIVDGAALVLVASDRQAAATGLTPRARILGTGLCASAPVEMLTGPAEAARRALVVAGLTFNDIDLFEVNEAFAAVPLHFMTETGVPLERVNIDGGAIAMGHPLGATGAMLTGTLLDALERTGGRRGLVTMCIGAGMASATVIERV